MKLSICIPTYNGGDKLRICLECLLKATNGLSDVEIIVSDNGSTDNTSEVLESYADQGIITTYRNKSNIGFSGNLKLLIDNYASGEYCWVIGDDDFVDFESVKFLLQVIDMHSPDYISIRHRCMTMEDYNVCTNDGEKNAIEYFEGSYFKCLDGNSSSTNILGTFMTTQLFKLSPIKKFDKSNYGFLQWDSFRGTFPNSFMMTETFAKEGKCVCVSTPIVTALIHPKAWDDKLVMIQQEILPDYLNYCYTLTREAKRELRNTRYCIYRDKFLVNYKLFKSVNYSQVDFKLLINKDFYNFITGYIHKKIRIYTNAV